MALKTKGINYIIFLDDDIVFGKNAFKEMHKAINKNKSKDIAGFGFNPKNNLKKNFLILLKKVMFPKNLVYIIRNLG